MIRRGIQMMGQAAGNIARATVGHVVNRIRAAPGEISTQFWTRTGPQGAAELAQGLMSPSNAYVPYGPGQQGVQPAQEASLQGPAVQAPKIEPVAPGRASSAPTVEPANATPYRPSGERAIEAPVFDVNNYTRSQAPPQERGIDR